MSSGPAIFSPAYYERLETLERKHWWCRSVRRVGLAMIEPLLSGSGSVLDAGCGTGGFLLALGRQAPAARVVGLDASLDALARARGQRVRRVGGASVSRLPFARDLFDIVVSNDVIQHLPANDDERFLAEAWRVLKPRGFLCLRSNLGSPVPAGPELFRRYAPAELAGLVRESGFSIRNHVVLHPLAALWGSRRGRRLADSNPSHHGLTLSMPARAVNTAIDLYSRLEDGVVRRLPFRLPRGDSQIVLAQKTDRYTAHAADD